MDSGACSFAIFHLIFHLKFYHKMAFTRNVPFQLQRLEVCDVWTCKDILGLQVAMGAGGTEYPWLSLGFNEGHGCFGKLSPGTKKYIHFID